MLPLAGLLVNSRLSASCDADAEPQLGIGGDAGAWDNGPDVIVVQNSDRPESLLSPVDGRRKGV